MCKVDGCTNDKIKAKDLCNKHYMQIKRHGCIKDKVNFKPNEIIIYDDYAEIILCDIKLNETARTKIDLEDIEKCNKYKWCLKGDGRVHGNINGKKILLHRFIMNAKDKEIIDHLNRNPLDNRKSTNLRICNIQQNNMNNSKRMDNKSGVVGVIWNIDWSKWTVILE